jgi:Domain of unknown function (DUF5745)
MAVASMDEELVKLTENLLDSLNLQLPAGSMEDYSFLKSDMFYVEIFKVIMEQSRHPFNEAEFDRETRGLTSGERIQTLINVLARDILNVDLEHIKGEKIAIGDTKHVSNMLQLLDALWQNYRQNPVSGEDDGEEEQKIESDLNRHDSFSQERELNRGVHEKKESNDFDTQARGDPDLFNKMMVDSDMHQQGASSAQGNIPMYTDDPINYNQIELQPKYYKAKGGKKQQTTSRPRPQSGIQTNSSLRQTRPKTAGLKSKKRGVVKIIEDNVYGARRDRNIKKRTLVKDPLAQVNPGVVREFNRLKKHGDDLEYDPMLLDGNIETLRQVLDANKKTTNVNDAVRRQKNQYRQELQDFIAFSKKVSLALKSRMML